MPDAPLRRVLMLGASLIAFVMPGAAVAGSDAGAPPRPPRPLRALFDRQERLEDAAVSDDRRDRYEESGTQLLDEARAEYIGDAQVLSYAYAIEQATLLREVPPLGAAE